MTDDDIERISDRLAAKLLKARATDPEAYVPSEVIEQHFSVSRATVHNWVHDEDNPCPHEMRGKILRFKLSAVDAWYCGRTAVLKAVR